ncbi:MAG: DUF4328 domain-containing protein [Actinomycetota bacterium]
MTSDPVHPLRPLDGVGGVLIALLALNGVASIAFGLLQVGELAALERYRRGDPISAGEVVDAINRSDLVSPIASWLIVLTGIVWLVWQHRAHANLRAAGVPHLAFTPRWAVGWWFVPFANLVKPFQTVREVWKASSGIDRWEARPTWPVIGWWWGMWVGGLAVGIGVGFAAAMSSDQLTQVDWMIRFAQIGLVSILPSIVMSILAIAIVRSVTDRQAGFVQVVADRIAVPTRTDLVPGDEGENP